MHSPEIIYRLKEYSDILRLFVSVKNWPRDYTITTGIKKEYADTGFECLERLWENKICTYLQGPMAYFFDPKSFSWFYERLIKIHPAAPLFMHIDRMSFMPTTRIWPRLKSSGLFDKRQVQKQIEVSWLAFLGKRYGRKIKRLFNIDHHPEDQLLIQKFVFKNQKLNNFPLFI